MPVVSGIPWSPVSSGTAVFSTAVILLASNWYDDPSGSGLYLYNPSDLLTSAPDLASITNDSKIWVGLGNNATNVTSSKANFDNAVDMGIFAINSASAPYFELYCTNVIASITMVVQWSSVVTG